MSILTKIAACAVLVPGLVLAAAATPALPQSQANAIIQKSGSAMGMPARGVRTLRVDETISAAGLSGTGTEWVAVAAPGFAEYASLPPTAQDDGYDGTVVWSRDRSGLVWNDGSDAGRAAEIDQAYVARMALWQPGAEGATVTSNGTKSDKGHVYDVLTVLPANSKLPMDLWFDSVTHVLNRDVLAVGPIVTTTTFSRYRRVGGSLFPFTVHSEGTDGNTYDGKVARVVLNPPHAAEHLARPTSNVNDFSIANGGTSTTVPFTLRENHVYLNVMLNGKGPYLFIFDTGGQNVVDPEVAKEIGAAGKGSAKGNGVGSATESLAFANVDTLQVGDAVLKDQLFAVAPVRTGFGISAGKTVDGLIGWEVLARFVTSFNYAQNQVVLTLPDSAVPPANAHVLPFVFSGTQPQIDCTIDGIPSQCTIDTGARDTLTFYAPYLAAHPQVVPQTLTAPGVNGFGFGGAAVGRLGRLQGIEIAGIELNNLVADYSTQTQGAFASPFLAANIGGNLLRRFNVTFDYGKQTMALVPNAAFNDPDQYERAGLFLVDKGGKVIVVDARPGTPAAEAGIVRGDVIATIDGMPTSAISLEQVRATFSKPAGTVLHLGIVAKDGTQKTVAVTLRDFV